MVFLDSVGILWGRKRGKANAQKSKKWWSPECFGGILQKIVRPFFARFYEHSGEKFILNLIQVKEYIEVSTGHRRTVVTQIPSHKVFIWIIFVLETDLVFSCACTLELYSMWQTNWLSRNFDKLWCFARLLHCNNTSYMCAGNSVQKREFCWYSIQVNFIEHEYEIMLQNQM